MGGIHIGDCCFWREIWEMSIEGSPLGVRCSEPGIRGWQRNSLVGFEYSKALVLKVEKTFLHTQTHLLVVAI